MEKNLEGFVMEKFLFKKYMILIFTGLGLFLNPCLVSPFDKDLQSELDLKEVIKKIKEREKTLKTFIAKFVQIKKANLLQEPLHSEGVIYYDRTGKVLLKVISPSPSLLLLKDNMLVTHYPDLLKTERRYIGETEDILKKYFSIGQSIEELKKAYEIELDSIAHSDGYHLKMIPKTNVIAKYIDTIEVVVSPKNWLPKRIYIMEVKGDYTSIRLQFISIDEPLPQDIFAVSFLEDHEDDL